MTEQPSNYLEINRTSWNARVKPHIESAFYDVDNFLKGKSSLKEIELKMLGDVRGKSILHLQCHFGQDSISLERMGAKVTGVDLSDVAIEAAKNLLKKTNTKVEFICCDLYELQKYLNKQFDLVFTTYGTIGWLPDLDKWAQLIVQYLKPGGQFIFAEFHPVIWMYDDYFKEVIYNYFNDGPIIENSPGTYADASAPIQHESVGWNHGIGEVLSCLLKNGLEINSFEEFDYSPYNCFKEAIESEPGKFRIKHMGNKIPMVYSIGATKPR